MLNVGCQLIDFSFFVGCFWILLDILFRSCFLRYFLFFGHLFIFISAWLCRLSALAAQGGVGFFEPIIQNMHKCFNFFELLLVIVHEFIQSLSSLIMGSMVLSWKFYLEFLSPIFTDVLKFSLLLQKQQFILRSELQLLELLFSCMETLHDDLKLGLQLVLDFFRFSDWLAWTQFFFRKIKFLESALLLFTVWWFNFSNLILIFEHFNANLWWSFWLNILFLNLVKVLINPIIQDVHEFLNLVEKILILIFKLNELMIFFFVGRFKIDFQFFLPFLLHIFKLSRIVKFFQFSIRQLLKVVE